MSYFLPIFSAQTSGGIAIPNDATLLFDMRDAKKKVTGMCKIPIVDFFKGKFYSTLSFSIEEQNVLRHDQLLETNRKL